MASLSKLTKESREGLIDALAKGLSLAESARLAGLGRRTVYDWLRRGDMGEAPYAALLRDIQRARAAGTKELLDIAHAQAMEDPGQVRYLLGTRDPARFGKEPAPVDALQEAYAELTEEEAATLLAKNPKIRAAVLAGEKKKVGKGGR